MSGLEAVGDAATGAVLAQAVEPEHGQAAGTEQGKCLNCGTALAGAYCHGCGQNSHLHRTITGFLHDLLHGVFHFEGKIWHTLPLLLFRPGELTRRYVAGERARFVSPTALFLFCVFLMFAVVGSLAGQMHAPEIRPQDRSRSLVEIQTSKAANEKQIAALRERVKAEDRAGRDTAMLEGELEKLENEQEFVKIAEGYMQGGGRTGDYKALGFTTGWATLDKGIAAANDNPNLFLYRLQTSAYKYSWLLIPLSTPLVWLLFCWKRQYRFYDHLVFVTFSITFMMLLVTGLTVAETLGLPDGLVVASAMLLPPLHMYRQVRGAYASGRPGAILRTIVLLFFALVVMTLYLMILIALGVMH